jgi:hypothetical protein
MILLCVIGGCRKFTYWSAKKCEKKVNEVNDEIKGLKNNFWTLKIRVYVQYFFQVTFYRSETWSLLLAEKCKFHLKSVVTETLKTEK